MTGLLFNVFVFLCAACLIVPLAGRLRLGSVLGYLVAGVLIGPFGAGLISNPEEILHFAEFGVVMMLFIIGLELEPEKLWNMRRAIIGLGGLQVVLTASALMLVGLALGFSWQAGLAVGLALSLSSTALVLQLLKEKGLMNTASGESSFAVLLMQDIAVIPILVLLPMLAGPEAVPAAMQQSWISLMPSWLRAEVVLGVIFGIVVLGRIASRHVFSYIASTNLREVFTALSLALVTGITLLMQSIGLSPALGAFIAGVVLANSEYRHTLEADIEPFKSLLLGLFFISVGMGMDFGLLTAHASSVLGMVALLLSVKMITLFFLGRRFGLVTPQNLLFTVAMCQGGEFAFVLLQMATSHQIIETQHAGLLTLTVAISMASTPLLMMLASRHLIPRFMSVLPEPEPDLIDEKRPVIIAGYGRFGQIIGRFLRGQGVPVTVLEISPEQIELLRKFGAQGYFGDASRLDLLHSAGAETAKLLVIAVDDPDKALEIARLARKHFPQLSLFARARNRRHAYELHKAGVHYFIRETFDASLNMAKEVMVHLGYRRSDMEMKAARFKAYDEKMLRDSFAFFEREPELISFSRQATQEMERILRSDEAEEGQAVSA